jgi:hypothetical protein
MEEKMERERERERKMVLRGRLLAQRLFRQMHRFDGFDVVLMHLDSILAAVTPEDVKYLLSFYDLSELRAKLRSYAERCRALADRIDELLREGMGAQVQ